mmetsp:Transcript_14346/g.39504  ORF Transcript_14346/g.39504 Transcript_14346/m.39504 type:complete len:231 (+) Transcript_14346:266-958(+)
MHILFLSQRCVIFRRRWRSARLYHLLQELSSGSADGFILGDGKVRKLIVMRNMAGVRISVLICHPVIFAHVSMPRANITSLQLVSRYRRSSRVAHLAVFCISNVVDLFVFLLPGWMMAMMAMMAIRFAFLLRNSCSVLFPHTTKNAKHQPTLPPHFLCTSSFSVSFVSFVSFSSQSIKHLSRRSNNPTITQASDNLISTTQQAKNTEDDDTHMAILLFGIAAHCNTDARQ